MSTETEVKFTPGPWEVIGVAHVYSRTARANIASASDPYSGKFIEYTPIDRESPHRHEAYANARLIAAAPTMLDAMVSAALPYEALLIDAESRKWIAPEVWSAIESSVSKIRAALALVDGPQNQETK